MIIMMHDRLIADPNQMSCTYVPQLATSFWIPAVILGQKTISSKCSLQARVSLEEVGQNFLLQTLCYECLVAFKMIPCLWTSSSRQLKFGVTSSASLPLSSGHPSKILYGLQPVALSRTASSTGFLSLMYLKDLPRQRNR